MGIAVQEPMEETDYYTPPRRSSRRLLFWGIVAVILLFAATAFLVSRLMAGGPHAAAVAANTAGAPAAVAATPAAATSSSTSGPATDIGTVVDPSTMSQPDRQQFLLRLIKQGVFSGVKAPPSPKVGVTALFMGLSPELQKQFVGVVDYYVNNGAAETEPLQVIDAKTNKPIGTYTKADGLKLQ